MSARKPGCSLATAIATALRKGPAPISGSSAFIATGVRTVAYTGVALALLQSNTSGAVTLGELRLKSSLGEPFRGTTTATLRQGEKLQPGCVTTSPYKLGTLRLNEPLLIRTPAASQPGQYIIELATAKPLYEPMYEVQLSINCPGTSPLTRSYIVMLDAPATTQAATASSPAASGPEEQVATPTTKPVAKTADNTNVPVLTEKATMNSPAPRAANNARRPGYKSINPGERYRVAKGDTLFGIAARVNERPAGTTWAVVNLLFHLNPDAFIDNQRGLIKLGATLTIPGSEVIANVKNDVLIEDSGNPSTPGPERKLPARPALVRNEQKQTEQEITARSEADSESAADAASAVTVMPEAATPVEEAVAAKLSQAELPRTTADVVASEAAVLPASASTNKVSTAATSGSAADLPSEPEPVRSAAATERSADTNRVSYPARDEFSPLLAGLIGMFLGALFATLVIFGRRILDRFARPDWLDQTTADQTTALDAAEFETTDAFEAYATAPVGAVSDSAEFDSIAAHIDTTADQPGPESGTLAIRVMGNEPAPEPPQDPHHDPHHGTIEVEFSELDSLDKQTFGFDMTGAHGADTAQQPKLGESPRLNLEGLGNNFDLHSELQEMLQEFSDTESALAPKSAQDEAEKDAENDAGEQSIADATDPDLEATGEVTHPDLSAGTGLDTMKDLRSLTEATGEHDSSNSSTNELEVQPFALGLDLDLGLVDEDEPREVDVSLEPETNQSGGPDDKE